MRKGAPVDDSRLLHLHGSYLAAVDLYQTYLEGGIGMILDNHVTGLYIDREFIAQFVTCYTGGIVVIDILIRTYIDITVFTGSVVPTTSNSGTMFSSATKYSLAPAFTSGLVFSMAR